MPTNPGNTVRIRSRNGGRASVYESNMWAQKFSAGLFSGNGVRQNTSADMNVRVGGSTTNPDVAIGQNPAGYNIALDLVSTQTLAITKPATNSRITTIVAYTNDLSLTSADAGTTGSPSSCGLIVVHGASSASPVAPSDSDIRTAITADGATGSQSTYAILATILVASTTTTITDTLITTPRSQMSGAHLVNGTVTSEKVDWTTFSHIDVNRTSHYSQPNTTVTYPFTNVFSSRGSNLTLNGSGQIVIGNGITKVRVSASVMAESVNGAYIYPQIRKNSTTIVESLNPKATGNYAGASIAPVIIPVTAGDIIELRTDANAQTATIRGSTSHMLVEANG